MTPALLCAIVHQRIVSRGIDAKGEFAILECGHKVRKYQGRRAPDAPAETTRRCKACENRSPYR